MLAKTPHLSFGENKEEAEEGIYNKDIFGKLIKNVVIGKK